MPFFIVSLWHGLNQPITYDFVLPVKLFAVMLFSDWADGWLARRYEWLTPTGKWLDPMADKWVDFCSWTTLLVFMFVNNDVEHMTALAMLGFWLLYMMLASKVVLRFYQDCYSQWWYKKHGGESNNWGKVKFNIDMLGIFLGMLGIHLAQVRGTTFHPPMITMISCLAFAIICAHVSLMIKQGKRPLPGVDKPADSLPSLVEGLAHAPQPFN